MAGIGAVFVLWLAVLIAPYAEGGLPGILLLSLIHIWSHVLYA